MRKVIYSVAASLDGYIAGPRGEFDWIPMDPEIDWAAFTSRFDTVLIGRRSYATVVDLHPDEFMPRMRVYVFSRTRTTAAHANAALVGDEGLDVVSQLRTAPGKDIWLFGGGVLFAGLLDAELVDEIEVAVVPILLGGGHLLLSSMERRIPLQLNDTKCFSSGIVLLSYRVNRDENRPAT